MSERLQLTLSNDLSELGRLAEAVEGFGEESGLDMKTTFNLNLALDELVTNLVNYAFPDGGEHSFTVSLWTENGTLWGELVDDGVPFNPLEVPEPDLEADVEERKIGGLGVHFVRQLMDEVSYAREQGHNRLLLSKRFA